MKKKKKGKKKEVKNTKLCASSNTIIELLRSIS